MTDDATRFSAQLSALFGNRAPQTGFARFLQLAGDTRAYGTILRGINSYANGRYPVPGEMRALLTIVEHAEGIKEMIRQARREPDPPAFQLRPLPGAVAN